MNDVALPSRMTCSALVITCSDFRFKSRERAFVETAHLHDDYDLIARPGAIRSLVAPRSPAARESLEDEIRMMWRLHRFTRVLMLHHLTCGAYTDIASPDTEREVHATHLAAAAPLIEQWLDGVKAEAYLLATEDSVTAVPLNTARPL